MCFRENNEDGNTQPHKIYQLAVTHNSAWFLMTVRMQDYSYCIAVTVLKLLSTGGKKSLNLVLIMANKTNIAVLKHWNSINDPCSALASLQCDIGAEELCPEKSAVTSMLVNLIISEHIPQHQLSCLHR